MVIKKKILSPNLTNIIITTLITSLFTLGTSYYLLYKQLDKEQEYWFKRMKTERLQVLLDREITLFEEINAGILSSEVLAKDLKLISVKFEAENEMTKLYKKLPESNTISQLVEKKINYQNHINELGSKLQMAELYFGPAVDTLIVDLGRAIEINTNNNLILKDTVSKRDMDNILEYFKKDFETIKLLENKRMEILKAMRNEMDKISIYLYKD